MDKSAVIIGGGLGGLFTAAILVKEGLKVSVIEKNPTCGGGLQSFTRMGEIFDTGMHVVGGMREGGNIYRLCHYLGIADKVHLRHVDEFPSDVIYIADEKKRYYTARGKEAFVDSFAKDFPDQRENLKAYVDALYAMVDELDMFYLRPAKSWITMHSDNFLISVNDFIDKYISDPKLALVLAYMNPLYGGVKDKTPAYIHALVNVLYINGASRFEGGSQAFANTLKEYIEDKGGEVILNDGVSLIATEDKLISYVQTRSGRRLSADHYISSIHPCSLLKLFDDPGVLPKAYRSRLDSLPNTGSAFTLNIKLKRGSFKYINHSCYYIYSTSSIWHFYSPEIEWPQGFLYMTPPDRNQGEYASKIIITAPMGWEKVRRWEDSSLGHRSAEYEAWKKECADKLLDKMEEIYPGFRENCVEGINTASPLTIRDWYGTKEGSMCGFSKDCNNITLSQVPIVTKVKNLLLTGQNCNVHGFCGVPLTAINTCEAILGLNYVINAIIESEKNGQ